MDDGKYAVVDEGSTNGTKVNQKKLEGEDMVFLNNSDILQVGGIEILFDDIEGERMGERTISVINLHNTGTSEINKTAMRNLGDRFAGQSTMLRENRKHTQILNITITVLLLAAAAFVAFKLFF